MKNSNPESGLALYLTSKKRENKDYFGKMARQLALALSPYLGTPSLSSWFASTFCHDSRRHGRNNIVVTSTFCERNSGSVQCSLQMGQDGTWLFMTCINLFRAAPLVFQPVVSLRVIKFMKSLWFGWQDVVRRVINICIVPVLSWPPTIWLWNGDPITSRSSARRMILYASF